MPQGSRPVRLYLATADLVQYGRSFEGFPLLLNDDFTPAEPAQTFLWHALVESGSVSSSLTWESYGRWLYDYFQFLQENDIPWDQPPGLPAASPLQRYRHWSLNELGNSRKTVNLYTGLVTRFYKWARDRGLIEPTGELYRPSRYRGETGLLSHVARGARQVSASKLREHQQLPAMLTMEQVRACRAATDNEGHALLFELMVQSGLRSVEARTFPLGYVFNPRLKKGLAAGPRVMLPIVLNPKDMGIKYGRPRTIHVPRPLMERLNAYAVHRRAGLATRSGSGATSEALILNGQGAPFNKDAVVDVFESMERRVGFRVRAHMLRHTYATYVLRALRRSPDFSGEPLLYVRDRLGHSDVKTTAVYLHLIDQLEAEAALAHEDYIDDLFARAEV